MKAASVQYEDYIFGYKNYIRYISAMLIAAMVVALAGFALPVNAVAAANIPEGFKKIAQTRSLALYCNQAKGSIAVEDIESGYIWKAVADRDVYNIESTNAQWKSNMASMLEIGYVEKKTDSFQKINSDSQAKDVSVSYINNGIKVDFNFKEAGIMIPLEIELDHDCLIVRIRAELIREKGENLLATVDLMPFFGAADRKTDGYLLYPDGSGAITRYDKTAQRPKDIQAFEWNIYSPEQVDLREFSQMNRDQRYQAMLPVYGIKNGNTAILAAVCEGEEDADIKLYPEGYGVNLNRIFFEFNYRRFYNINLSNIIVNGKSTAKKPVGTKIDKEMIKKDREVRIFFMNGDAANYSGMASVYRDYLVKNNLIKKVISKKDNIPLGLDLFMGIKEERLLFDKFISMTTFNNAQTISEELKKEGVENMEVMLKGWTKGGYGVYPVNWPPENKLGGSKGLNAYSDYAANNGIKLYLQNDFMHANTKNGGFSPRKDVVMQGNNLPVTNQGKNAFLLNPFKAFERFMNFLAGIRNYSAAGVALENIGSILYHDYNRANPSDRGVTIQKWSGMMADASKTGRPVAIDGGNQYVLKYADRLQDIPVKSSDYYITDESVPFYQMVVHGMIPYTSEPANLSYDLVSHKLKWVEYGCMPYFELTYQKSIDLKDTEYSRLFTSYYGDWYKEAAELYKEFNNRLKGVWSEKMTSHEKLGKNLYRVGYSNDTVIYINYGQADAQYNGYRINAQDYLVVEKGGQVK